MPTSEQIEKAARAIYDELEGPVANQDFARQQAQWAQAQKLAHEALSAAEGVKPRTITVSDLLAEELKTWAEDERAAWPTDTAFQDDLADLLAQLSALEGE